ncbi:MAG: tRNA pseudouridine(55) synthase TruB [Propionibacteriaceae bacterium]|nr:tRNA pseudouridine(55) synthase TruB [Propionibacteriaceae bacterium]
MSTEPAAPPASGGQPSPTAGAGRPEPTPSGFVLVDKPAGWTSHDVVARLRRLVGTRRVGHAGTLDPMATGLLVCGVGRATRLLGLVGGEDKTYIARLRCGVETVTDDAMGLATAARGAAGLSRAELVAAGQAFLGAGQQVPSAVSAVKVGGRRAYDLVRRGQTPELAARPIRIDRLEWGEAVVGWWTPPADDPSAAGSDSAVVVPDRIAGVSALDAAGPDSAAVVPDPAGPAPDSADAGSPPAGAVPVLDIDLAVDCSAGVYIRALARDLGRAVGAGAHLIALRRTRSGALSVDEAEVGAAELAAGRPVAPRPVADVLTRVLPYRVVDAEQARRIGYGQDIGLDLAGPTALVDERGRALAVYRPEGGRARPQVVLQGAGSD